MDIVYTTIVVLGLANIVTMLLAMKTRRKLKTLETSLVAELNRHHQYIGNQTKDCMDMQVEMNRLKERVNRLEFGD